MSIKVPKYRIKDDQVFDLQDMNENFREIIDEVGGHLNEHNWKSAAFPSRDPYADGIAMRIYKVQVADTVNDGLYTYGTAATWTANTWAPPKNGTWNVVDQMTLSITTAGCLFWALTSLQVAGGTNNTGAFFALRVDGQIIPETIIGTCEPEQDRNGNVGLPLNSVPTMPSGACVVTEALIPLPAGQHTIDVVAYRYPGNTGVGTSANELALKNRELLGVEMLR